MKTSERLKFARRAPRATGASSRFRLRADADHGENACGGSSASARRYWLGRRGPTLHRSLLERAVAGGWLVDSPRCASRNKRNDDSHEVHVSLVSHHMDVETPIHESRTSPKPVRAARGISAQIDRRRPRLDYHEARPGMAVPPKGPARCDPVLKDMDVGGSRRLHACVPRTDLALRIDGTKFSDPEFRWFHARGGRRQDSSGVHGTAQDNGKRSPRQFRSHLSSFCGRA
jgi:hypothetical protein